MYSIKEHVKAYYCALICSFFGEVLLKINFLSFESNELYKLRKRQRGE